jgi:4-hydroxybenzoate polyprenyltransferase
VWPDAHDSSAAVQRGGTGPGLRADLARERPTRRRNGDQLGPNPRRRGRVKTPTASDANGLTTTNGPLRTIAALASAVRPHQWAKNALVFLPVLAAHKAGSDVYMPLAKGVAAFCLTASAVYLCNDIIDLPKDRVHPRKRHRALASGALSIRAAGVTAVLLLAAAATLASSLPSAFWGTLGFYVAVSMAYSLDLRRRPVVDVITLATLYAVRVVAGAALVSVPLSRWFVALAVFLFLSLALVKRVVELQDVEGDVTRAGRGYRPSDVPVLVAIGCASTVASMLVYCLYITGEDVLRLYRHPDVLWFGLPLLLYWQTRVWLFTSRRAMHHDPVVFALRDRVSYVIAVAFLGMVLVAT